MCHRLLIKFAHGRRLTNDQARRDDRFITVLDPKTDDHSRRMSNRERSRGKLHHRGISGGTVQNFRHRIGLMLFGALVFALLPTSAANAAQSEYGSIAWSRSTAVVAAGFAGSIDDAAQAAISQCQAQSGASDCKAYGWFYQAYATFAHGSVTGWGFGWGTNAEYADSYAMQYCQQNSSDCQIALRTQTPEVSADTPPAAGGTFATPITPSPTPTYQPSPTYEPAPTYPPSAPSSPYVSVPNLRGLSLNTAQQALPQGLTLGTVTGSGDTVVDQQPKPGDVVPPNSSVDLMLSTPGFPTWLAVLLVVLTVVCILALLVAQIMRQHAQRQRWNAAIRVKSTPDPNPITRLQEPGKTVRFAVQVEVHPDPGVQTLQEVATP